MHTHTCTHIHMHTHIHIVQQVKYRNQEIYAIPSRYNTTKSTLKYIEIPLAVFIEYNKVKHFVHLHDNKKHDTTYLGGFLLTLKTKSRWIDIYNLYINFGLAFKFLAYMLHVVMPSEGLFQQPFSCFHIFLDSTPTILWKEEHGSKTIQNK